MMMSSGGGVGVKDINRFMNFFWNYVIILYLPNHRITSDGKRHFVEIIFAVLLLLVYSVRCEI
jgi:hypothetical protein